MSAASIEKPGAEHHEGAMNAGYDGRVTAKSWLYAFLGALLYGSISFHLSATAVVRTSWGAFLGQSDLSIWLVSARRHASCSLTHLTKRNDAGQYYQRLSSMCWSATDVHDRLVRPAACPRRHHRARNSRCCHHEPEFVFSHGPCWSVLGRLRYGLDRSRVRNSVRSVSEKTSWRRSSHLDRLCIFVRRSRSTRRRCFHQEGRQ